MSFDADRIETIFVDSYSTLVDELSTRQTLAQYTDNPEAVAHIWDLRGSLYGLATALLDDFQSTRKRYEVSLEYALQAVGAEVTDGQRQAILDSIDELTVFDDVPDGLERLTENGYPVYILSNGDPDMLSELVSHAGIDEFISGTISAADAGVCKPDRKLYRHAAARAKTAVTEIAHVTASWYDIQGAMHTGMQGIWINRSNSEWEDILKEPDLRIHSIHELADQLGV